MIAKRKINKRFKVKLLESLRSIVPVTVIVLVLALTFVPMPLDAAMKFLIGSAFLIIGLALFTLGVDVAMTPIGDMVGTYLGKKNKLWLYVIMGIVLGFIITLTEPGVQMFALLVPDIPTLTLVLAMAAGIGFSLAVAFLREVLHIKFNYIILVFYTILFILAFFVPEEFLPIAFDAGGATTGEMTVPFIMALGVGIAFTQKGNVSKDDNFGLIGLCPIGSITAVMILSFIFTPNSSAYTENAVYYSSYADTATLGTAYAEALLGYLGQAFFALTPIIIFFLIFCFVALKLSPKRMMRVFRGILYTFVGLSLILAGAKVGFMPAGNILGQYFASSQFSWLLIVAGMIFGYFIIAAEPAVYVLNKQVSEITKGAISQRAMSLSLSIGVALSIGFSMFRVLTGIPILWILLPGYVLAIGLSFVTPKIFTAIAFDAGGVASGPLVASFLLPMSIGASYAFGGNIGTDAFGLIAMVAMTPPITVQIMGLYVRFFKKTS